MILLSEKELTVLRALLKDSNRSRKSMAAAIDLSESELSKITTRLTELGVIKKFTVSLDYNKIGFHDQGLFLFSVKDKKKIPEIIDKLKNNKEIIEIHEVFGEEHDICIRIMAENNARIRKTCQEISQLDEVNSDERSFTLIFAETYKKDEGVQL